VGASPRPPTSVEADPVKKSPGVLQRFACLLGAFGFREFLQTVFFIYLARTHPVAFGELFLALSVGSIIQFTTDLGFNQHLGVLLSNRKDSRSLLLQVTVIKGGFLFCGCAVLFLFSLTQESSSSLRAVLMIVAFGLGLDSLASSFFVALEIENRQRDEGTVRCVAAGGGFLYGFSALCLGLASPFVAVFKLLEALINLIGSFSLSLRSLTSDPREWRLAALWSTWKGGLLFTAIAAVSTLYNRLNVVFLQSTAGERVLAQYGVAWQLVDGVGGLVSELLLRSTLFPLFLILWNENRPVFVAKARQASSGLLVAGLLVSGAIYLESDRVISLLYGPTYGPAVAVMQSLAICVTISVIHNLAAYLLIVMGRTRELLGFYLLGLVVNLLACPFFIPRAPLLGAVAAVVVTRIIVAVCTIGACQRGLGLLSGRMILSVVVAVGIGVVVQTTGSGWVGRDLSALLTLAPLALLGWPSLKALVSTRESVHPREEPAG